LKSANVADQGSQNPFLKVGSFLPQNWISDSFSTALQGE
jgi:hypothetical protein